MEGFTDPNNIDTHLITKPKASSVQYEGIQFMKL